MSSVLSIDKNHGEIVKLTSSNGADVDAMPVEAFNAAVSSLMMLPRPALRDCYIRMTSKRAIDAVHSRLLDWIANGRAKASDILLAFDCNPVIAREVLAVATDLMQVAHCARIAKRDGIDCVQLRAYLGQSLDEVGSCALVLEDKTGRFDDSEFESGYIIARIRSDDQSDTSDARALLKKLPGGITGVWFKFFLDTNEGKQGWVPPPGTCIDDARFAVIKFPPPCNGGDNDAVPAKPSQWIGESFCGCDGKDPLEAQSDFHEEISVYPSLEDVCQSIAPASGRHHIELVASAVKDNTRIEVLFRSNRVSNDDLTSCMIY